MNFKNNDYYDIRNMLTQYDFYVFVGGRANRISKLGMLLVDILSIYLVVKLNIVMTF